MNSLFWKVIFFIDFHFSHKVMKYIFLQFVHSFHHPIFRKFVSCACQVTSQSKVSSWIPKIRSSTNFYSHRIQSNRFVVVGHTHQPDGLTWSSILSEPSKTIFWKCSCLSWAREAVKYKRSGTCLYMYAHNSHIEQFLPCWGMLLRFKFRCSSLFPFTELILVGSDVILNGSMFPEIKSTPHQTSHMLGQEWQENEGVMAMTKE